MATTPPLCVSPLHHFLIFLCPLFFFLLLHSAPVLTWFFVCSFSVLEIRNKLSIPGSINSGMRSCVTDYHNQNIVNLLTQDENKKQSAAHKCAQTFLLTEVLWCEYLPHRLGITRRVFTVPLKRVRYVEFPMWHWVFILFTIFFPFFHLLFDLAPPKPLSPPLCHSFSLFDPVYNTHDPGALVELERHTQTVAAELSYVMDNLRNSLHAMSLYNITTSY